MQNSLNLISYLKPNFWTVKAKKNILYGILSKQSQPTLV